MGGVICESSLFSSRNSSMAVLKEMILSGSSAAPGSAQRSGLVLSDVERQEDLGPLLEGAIVAGVRRRDYALVNSDWHLPQRPVMAASIA